MKNPLLATVIGTIAGATLSSAAIVELSSGVTSVDLDFAALENAAGLVLQGTDNTVPAATGFAVGFPVNPRNAAEVPTNFTFDSPNFSPFAGTIEHTGTVSFGLGQGGVILGNFTIGFDASRVVGEASGFFVASTTGGLVSGLDAIIFDISGPVPAASASGLTLTGTEATGGAGLLVSPELAGVLGDENLAGALVGSARLDAAAIPEPAAILLSLLAVPALIGRRRS